MVDKVNLEDAEEFAKQLHLGMNTAYTSWPGDLLLMACAEIKELRQQVETLTAALEDYRNR